MQLLGLIMLLGSQKFRNDMSADNILQMLLSNTSVTKTLMEEGYLTVHQSTFIIQ